MELICQWALEPFTPLHVVWKPRDPLQRISQLPELFMALVGDRVGGNSHSGNCEVAQ